MNAPAAPDLADGEVVTFSRWLARTYLEIERGQRSAETLERFALPLLVRRLRCGTRPLPQPPQVTAADLRGAYVARVSPERIFGAVIVRDHHDVWDALLIELRALNRSWVVTELCRLRDRCTRLASPPVTDSNPIAEAR